MLIPLKEILKKHNLRPKGVIQVGSHWCEEHEEFVKCGIERFVYIEPCKEAFDVMQIKRDHKFIGRDVLLFNVACGSEEGEMPMYVSHQNQGQSNSILKPQGHLIQHPEIVFDDAEVVKVVRLDNLPIDKEKYDMLVMDCQGYEGEVLKGATETLKHISIIYTECNRGQTYSGNMEIEEMDELLLGRGFYRMDTYWPSDSWTWGDCIYLKGKNWVKDILNND